MSCCPPVWEAGLAEPEAAPPRPTARMLLPLHTPSCSPFDTAAFLSAHPTRTPMEQQHHFSSFPSTCTWQEYNKFLCHRAERALENLTMVPFTEHHHLSSRVCCCSSPTPSALWVQNPRGSTGSRALVLCHGAASWCPVPVPASPGHCSPGWLCTGRGETGLLLLSLSKQNAALYTSNQVGRINFPLAMLSC